MWRRPEIASPAEAKPGPVRVAAGLAVAGDAGVDRARVARVDVLGPEAPLLHRAGAEVLEHDVGGRGELGGDPLALGLAQVERDGALVAGQDRPPQRAVVVAQAAPVAHRVAGAGRLDLDHVGAEVPEQRAGERAGEQLPELDRAQSRSVVRPCLLQERDGAEDVHAHHGLGQLGVAGAERARRAGGGTSATPRAGARRARRRCGTRAGCRTPRASRPSSRGLSAASTMIRWNASLATIWSSTDASRRVAARRAARCRRVDAACAARAAAAGSSSARTS